MKIKRYVLKFKKKRYTESVLSTSHVPIYHLYIKPFKHLFCFFCILSDLLLL